MQLLKPVEQFSRLEKTAYHEAAHAVAHYLLGMPFTRVSITADEVSLGRVVPGMVPKRVTQALESGTIMDSTKAWVEKRIEIFFAGVVTDEVLGCSPEYQTSDEYQALYKLACRVTRGVDEWMAFCRWLQERTKSLILFPDNWALVEMLADALLKKREITATEAHRLFRGAGTDARVLERIDELTIGGTGC